MTDWRKIAAYVDGLDVAKPKPKPPIVIVPRYVWRWGRAR